MLCEYDMIGKILKLSLLKLADTLLRSITYRDLSFFKTIIIIMFRVDYMIDEKSIQSSWILCNRNIFVYDDIPYYLLNHENTLNPLII